MRVTETWLVDPFSEQVKSAEHMVKTGGRLLGASIHAVPLSQPFPIKNYF